MSAFSIPLSGLEATSQSLNVIANNLANLNTDGYKDETLNFGDIFNQMQGTSGNGDPIQTGSGVQSSGTSSNFSNGSVTSTGVASNMALQGNGFFVVQNGTATDYTRAGDFTVNSLGQLTTSNGELVMGYPATNGVVSTSETIAPISVNQSSTIPAVASSTFQMSTNLDSSAGVGATFNTPITVYDSLGTSQTLSVQYTNTAANKWSYTITLPASATGGTGNPTTVASGNLTFDTSGNLTSPTGTVPGIKITGLADGAADMNLTWNLNNTSGSPSITQQDSTSATSTTTQNGYGVGTLSSYSVLPDGTVQGQFSNSQTLALGQVAIASFANAQGLAQSGQSDYQATYASGSAVVGQAGAGGNGTITGGAVEGSNVDLSTEFANMIVAQQGYEANAKALTTLDQISQATLQMMTA
ncbi:MAG TPA: flagellar hook protein FlgE [Acidobacteriaceae bacterium]|jgi:flagellar hook protein FlgE|nr:flagellar hook protein FlgE [Acidobacteriaceae bacterium]